MRRLMFLLVAASFLGSVVGCSTCGSGGCGLGGAGGCGAGGCGASAGAGGRSQAHGVCDCTVDDYCTSRTPWIRYGQMAPVSVPAAETIPAPAKVLPKAEMKL